MLPDLGVKSFWVRVLDWGQWHLVWTLRSFLFSLYPLKGCKLWKDKIRCRKCDFVVTASPHYLLLAMVLGQHLTFLYSLCVFAIFLPKASSSILTWLKMCLTKPCCSFFSVNYCHGVTEEASSEAGFPSFVLVLVQMHVRPCIQMLPLEWAKCCQSCSSVHLSCPSAFSGTFVWVPVQDHGINLLILKSKKRREMYGQNQLNTPLGCRGIFTMSGGAFPLMGSLRNSMWGMQKQNASFIAVEADVWLETSQETKNSVSDALPLVSQVNISSWWTLIIFLALK